MKVGMIFECGPDGADKKVCEHLALRLNPDIEIKSVTLTNKPGLIEGCGQAAAQLLREGCERIIIVWDLYPPWREAGGRPCRKEDREAILRSLTGTGVTPKNVHLVCITEELEAWLLADSRALSAVLSTPAHPVRVRDLKRPEQVKNPKKRMNRIFLEHTGRPYNDRLHAEMIVRELKDLTRIRRCQSFARFALVVTGETPR